MPDLTTQLVQQVGLAVAAVTALTLAVRQYLRQERFGDMAEGIAKLAASVTAETAEPLRADNARLRAEIDELRGEVAAMRDSQETARRRQGEIVALRAEVVALRRVLVEHGVDPSLLPPHFQPSSERNT